MESKLFSRTPSLFEPLTKTISGDVDCSMHTLEMYSKDSSPYRITPQAVVYPKNSTDIKHVISFAKEYRMPITVCGGKTAGNGGTLGEGIILDLTRYLTGIRVVHIMENTVTVDAGAKIKDIQAVLHAQNMEVPLFEGVDDSSTAGGWATTASVSPSSFHYGSAREWIEGLTVIVDTGEEHHLRDGITPSGRLLGIYQTLFPLLSGQTPILRAAKPENKDDATGYNLWSTSIGPRQLIDELISSEGTLGIISSITFRITPRVAHSITTAISLPDAQSVSKCVAISIEHSATAIYMYDKNIQTLLEHVNTNNGLLVNSPYTLLITHRSNDLVKLHAVITTWRRALNISEENISAVDEKIVRNLCATDNAAKLLNSYTNHSQSSITTTNGIIVSEQNYNSLLGEIEKYVANSGKLYTITGCRASGHIALTFLLDARSPNYTKELLSYTHDIFTLVKKYKGGISAQGGDGLAHTPYLPLFYNEATCDIFKKVKEAWDPQHIFNPSKKVQLSTQYLHDHV